MQEAELLYMGVHLVFYCDLLTLATPGLILSTPSAVKYILWLEYGAEL